MSRDNGNASLYEKEDPRNANEIIPGSCPMCLPGRGPRIRRNLYQRVWHGDWASLYKMPALARMQIEESDIISFHNYGWPEDFEQRVLQLQQFHRPLICTEYMARGSGQHCLTRFCPFASKYHVGAINWGLVAGKSQTYLRGTPGSIRMWIISRLSGFTMYFTPTARRTASARWRLFAH